MIKNKNNLAILLKTYFLSLLFFSSLFILSSYTFSKILHTKQTSENINISEEDVFSQFLEREKINSDLRSDFSSYTIYANTDPVIQRIEIFLAKNQNKLTQEEISKVEKFRSERITYLMAKRYLDVTKTQLNN